MKITHKQDKLIRWIWWNIVTPLFYITMSILFIIMGIIDFEHSYIIPVFLSGLWFGHLVAEAIKYKFRE